MKFAKFEKMNIIHKITKDFVLRDENCEVQKKLAQFIINFVLRSEIEETSTIRKRFYIEI